MADKEIGLELHPVIRSCAVTMADPAGRERKVLGERDAKEMAARFGLTVHDVHREALGLGICPLRYLRNGASISEAEQLTLCTSCVAVVGAGGLGGHVILLLARIGIGRLVVVDPDRFDETNLNRQALSGLEAIGRWKAEEAGRVVAGINPGVRLTLYRDRVTSANAQDILREAEVVVDALDNIPDRFTVAEAAKSLGIPLVHGAVAGFEGQVMTIFPEDPGLKLLYGTRPPHGKARETGPSRGPEVFLGVPTLTPAVVAGLQAAEVLKIILKRGSIFRNRMLHVDLETGEIRPFTFEERG